MLLSTILDAPTRWCLVGWRQALQSVGANFSNFQIGPSVGLTPWFFEKIWGRSPPGGGPPPPPPGRRQKKKSQRPAVA